MKLGFHRTVALVALFFICCALVIYGVLSSETPLQPYVVEHAALAPESAAGDTEPAVASMPASEQININTASAEVLQSLSGIGEVLSARIIEYREANGPFYDIGELREVKGIGDALLEKLAPYICV